MSSAAKSRRTAQRGYILLTLMLFFALLAIAAAAIAPTIAFQIQRDREEELIHRGVQYSRAVRHFYKKFGRYPVSLDDLDKTANMRFLRKRYKDPVTGKDFKLLHVGEVQMMGGAGVAGAMAVAAIAANQAAGSKTIAGSAGGGPGAAAQALFNTAMGAQMAQAAGPSNPLPDNGGSTDSDSTSDSSGKSAGGKSASKSGGSSPGTGQVFGGGPVVGVASTSKAATIREFNQKNHYNDWQFIYDPGTDRGGLLNTPAQPPLQNGMTIPQPIAPAVTGGPGAAPGMMPTQTAPGQPMPPGMQPQQPQQ